MYILSCFKHNKLVYYIFLSLLFVQTILDEVVDLTVNDAKIFELDSLYVIKQIKFTKNSDEPFDYLFGIFEASNYSASSNFLPIGMIKESESINSGEISLDITSPCAFKYIRYNPPKSNGKYITNIKISRRDFSETDTPSGNYFTPTNLPLMIINTKNSEEPLSLENYIDSTIILINGSNIINQSASIKLRGHSTATRPKKPYKIKFNNDKKEDLLYLGAFKKWAILANHYDKSLIRNILAFEISKIVELKFTPNCKPVDVIVNGNFRGNYFICDQIEVKKKRVDIEKNEGDDISGGYLIEIDKRATEEEKFFLTDKGLVGEIKYPDEDDITKEQENYIKQYLNKLEKYTYLGDLKYLDLPSFYKYFIVQEFCGDIDSMLSSFHCHKKKADDKLYFGPVWDYDLSFDNDDRLIPTNEKDKFALYYGASAGSTRDFFINLLKTKDVMKNIEKTWTELKAGDFNIEKLKAFINEQKTLLEESANLNSLKWYGSKIGKGKDDFVNSVNVVINYIEKRFDSLTNLIANFDFAGDILKINYFIFCLIFVIL